MNVIYYRKRPHPAARSHADDAAFLVAAYCASEQTRVVITQAVSICDTEWYVLFLSAVETILSYTQWQIQGESPPPNAGHRNRSISRSTHLFARKPKSQHARSRSAAGARVYASVRCAYLAHHPLAPQTSVKFSQTVVLQSNGAEEKTMKVMISGAPATGKGTQCLRIVDKVSLSIPIPCVADTRGL